MSELLARSAHELGFHLTDSQSRLFDRYTDFLLSAGRIAGVTAIATKERVEQRHFVESIALARALLDARILDESHDSRIIDVGTGGGFPGLPIKIVLPKLRLTLLDARERVAAFLRDLLCSLDIEDVDVVAMRAEDAGRDPTYRETFDAVLARALAPLPVLLELGLPLLRIGGHLAAPKGSGALGEIAESQHALEVLRGVVISAEPLNAPGGVHTQRLVLIRKNAVTPARYPRRPGIPKKRPL